MAEQKKPPAIAPGAGWTAAQRQAVTSFAGSKAARGSAANPYVPETRAQYDGLPGGAYYLASDGTFSRKPQSAQQRAAQEATRSMGHSRNYDRGRAFTQGATFGWGDEAVAAAAAGGVWFDNVRGRNRGYTPQQAYQARMKAEQAARDAYEKAHPWESKAFEAGGELATNFIPMGSAARGAALLVKGGKLAKGAVEAGRVVKAVEVARTPLERLAVESARQGWKDAAQGALSGAGQADPGSRVTGALQGAQTAYIVGRLSPYAGAVAKSGVNAVIRKATGVAPMTVGTRVAADSVNHALHLDKMAGGRVPVSVDSPLPFENGGDHLKELGLAAALAPSRGRPEAIKTLAGRAAELAALADARLARALGADAGLGDRVAELAARRAEAQTTLDGVVGGMEHVDIDPASVSLLPRHVLDAAGEGLDSVDPRAFYAARERLAQSQPLDALGRPRIASPEAMGRTNALRMADDHLVRAGEAYGPARANLDAIDNELAAFDLGGRALFDPDLSPAVLSRHVAAMSPGAQDQFRAGFARAATQARAAQGQPLGMDGLSRLRAVLPDQDFDAVLDLFGREAALRRTTAEMVAPRGLAPGMPEAYRDLFAHPGSAIPAARALNDPDAMRALLNARALDEALYGRAETAVDKLMVEPAKGVAKDRLDDLLFQDEDEPTRGRAGPRLLAR